MRKNRLLAKRKILINFIVLIIILGANLSFVQKDFFMKEKMLYEKYKMSIKNFEAGQKQFHKGDYKKAEKELKKCLEVFPQHIQAHFYLSQIFHKKEDFSTALEHIEQAEANFEFMNRMYVFAYEDYTSMLREQRDQCQAKIPEYKEKLSTTTDQAQRNTYEQAIASLEREIRTIDNRLTEPLPQIKQIPAEYFYVHGNIFFKLKKYQEAYGEYLQAVETDPKHGNAYNNLANLYYMAKQYQKALDCLNQAEANGVKINTEFKKAILKALEK